ncbi:hypothetical protein Avbf_01416 [Armadillidium vulgare]|nr:hypothetical protein Avbf_01416 [Armadillidium vulgare]
MSEGKLRQPEDAHQPCLTCNRKFFKSDAHWCCDKCRLHDERATCPENCDACIAMEEEEWRRKAWEMNLYKKKMYEKSKAKFGRQSRKVVSKKRVNKGKPEKRGKMRESRPKRESNKSKNSTVDPVYANRLLNFETLLYGGLNPSIPASLTEKGFNSSRNPKTSERHNRSQFCDENNQIFNANSDGIVSLFAALIKFKANSFGKIIFDIRETLLSGATCADPDIIPQMIKGPIKPEESFFGNINALKEAVNQDSRNILKMKGSDSSKEPSSSEELNDEQSNILKISVTVRFKDSENKPGDFLTLQSSHHLSLDSPVTSYKPSNRTFGFSVVNSRMPGDERGSPSSMSEFDSALGTSTASPGSVRKANSGCSSMSDREEENFECYGEAEDGECDSDSAPARIGLCGLPIYKLPTFFAYTARILTTFVHHI